MIRRGLTWLGRDTGWRVVVAALASGLIFLLDSCLPLGLTVGILHVLPVLVAAQSSRLGPSVAIGALATVLVVVKLSVGVTAPGLAPWIPVLNRVFSVAVIWTVVLLMDRQRRARLALRRKEAAVAGLEAAFFNAAPDALVAVDGEGVIRAVNHRVTALLGYERDELLGQPLERLVPGEHRAQHREHRGRYLLDPRPRAMGAGIEIRALHKDGRQIPVEIALAKVGERILAAIRDDTARREAGARIQAYARELERSNADLEQFAYVASHDLQEPLRMIASFTALLESRYSSALDERGRRYAGFVIEGARRMQQLLQDLLAYARAGQRPLDRRPVDATALVDRVLTDLQVAIREAGAEVERGELPAVVADPTQLGQVFQNLVANALRYRGAAAPRIRIDARRADDGWVFSVADNGIGIEPQYHERIFRMFQSLHERGKYPGTGIGLAIVKTVLERHEGRIWLESTPGAGTTFCFSIPDRSSERRPDPRVHQAA